MLRVPVGNTTCYHARRVVELEAQLQAEREAQSQLTRVIGAAQAFQPAGSPPPGDGPMLVRWICQSLEAKAATAAADLERAREENARLREAALALPDDIGVEFRNAGCGFGDVDRLVCTTCEAESL